MGKRDSRPFLAGKTRLEIFGGKMKIETIRTALLWCSIINYGILLVWFLVFVAAHDFVYRLHGKWFRLSTEQFDALHYGGMSLFKIGIMLLNLAPLIALWVVG